MELSIEELEAIVDALDMQEEIVED
jgi:hypothetical protein